ncbi:hypothetical protein ACFQPG_04260 [Sphingomonas sp. GCM10030256]|uniref:hypothetical protein n=1 Tax=Sphingomonas sp. GCM10030256 TaxID=3273427 RepID=UPI00360E7B2B
MTEADTYAPRPVAGWFKPAAIATAVWMMFGCAVYLYQVTVDPAELPLDQRAMLDAAPTWMWGAFAIAVWVGLAGAVMLLMRRKIAEPLLLVSLIAVLVQFSAYFLDPELRQSMSSDQLLMPIIVVALGWTIYFFARHSRMRGWLK